MIDNKKWRDLVKTLRWECPCPIPVKVRRVKVSQDIYGDTEYLDKPMPHYVIRISSDIEDWGIAKSTLIHEWAHCFAHSPHLWMAERTKVTDHGPQYGIAYAACYTAVEENQ